ncbi:MAG TPA: sigma-70 family RNA polymerase sigma factor [Ilumatobacteraceae bacterium]
MGEWDVSDEGRFSACYRATFAEVYRYAGILCGPDRRDAEDLVQEVYLAALRKARDGTLTSLSTGYLITSLRHRRLDRLRHDRREMRRLELVAATVDDVDQQLDERSRDELARLSDLPARERAAMVLRFVDALAVAEVAEEMGIGLRAAESLLARATRRLRRQEARDA